MKKNSTFDLVSALTLISIEPELSTTFKRKFPIKKGENFESVISNAKDGTLSKDASDYVLGLFNSVILDRTIYLDKYKAISADSINKVISTEKTTVSNNKKIIDTVPNEVVKVKKLPKEYNKIKIDADVKANGGVATEFHQAMYALNEMKNIRARLNAKGKKRRYLDPKYLSDEECRLIIATVRMIKNKLGKI